MRTNRLFFPVCAASAVVLAFRVAQLLCLNDQGVVKPAWLSAVLYCASAAAALLSLIAVRKSHVSAENADIFAFPVMSAAIPVLGFSLILEGAAAFLGGVYDLSDTAAYVALLLAGLFTVICFAVYCTGDGASCALSPIIYVALLVFLVLRVINVFVSNSTGVAFILNVLTLLVYCGEMFFVKAAAREFEGCPTESSRSSLLRSGFFLLSVLPAEIAGQAVFAAGLVKSQSCLPVRGSVIEMIADAAVLFTVIGMLAAVNRSKYKPGGLSPCPSSGSSDESGDAGAPSDFTISGADAPDAEPESGCEGGVVPSDSQDGVSAEGGSAGVPADGDILGADASGTKPGHGDMPCGQDSNLF